MEAHCVAQMFLGLYTVDLVMMLLVVIPQPIAVVVPDLIVVVLRLKYVVIMSVVVSVNIVVEFIAAQLVECAVTVIVAQQDIFVLMANVFLPQQQPGHNHHHQQHQQHHRDQLLHQILHHRHHLIHQQQLLLLFINLIDAMKILNVLYFMLINGMNV